MKTGASMTVFTLGVRCLLAGAIVSLAGAVVQAATYTWDAATGELVPWTEERLAAYSSLSRHLEHVQARNCRKAELQDL